MNVLYIGNYRDGTGYGQAAEDYILSLNSVGVDVVCRPLKLNDVDYAPNPIVSKLESKSSKNCDVVIQHMLPIHMQYNGDFDYNIGLFAYETSNFKMSGWKNYLNLMDANVVINKQMIDSCLSSGVNTPLHVVPHARDFSRYIEKYEKLETITSQVSDSDFIFYTIGETTKRKNFSALLKAYFTEFSESEPVCLLVKTNNSTYEFYDYCGKILDGLCIKNPPKVVTITERMSNEDINRLHYTCNAFVQPSYGEAWGIPAFDAMAFGKTPIVTNCTGYLEYIDESVLKDFEKETGIKVVYELTSGQRVFGIHDPDLQFDRLMAADLYLTPLSSDQITYRTIQWSFWDLAKQFNLKDVQFKNVPSILVTFETKK